MTRVRQIRKRMKRVEKAFRRPARRRPGMSGGYESLNQLSGNLSELHATMAQLRRSLLEMDGQFIHQPFNTRKRILQLTDTAEELAKRVHRGFRPLRVEVGI